MASAAIYPIRTVSGNQPQMRRIIEKAAMSFKAGTPVEIDVAGGSVMVWDGTTVAGAILGISAEDASSLTTAGVAKTLTYGSVPNEASAVNIPRGAPMNDGRVGVFIANDDTTFFGQVGPATTTAVTDIGKQYGLTVDTDGHWYVDKSKSTAGVNTVVMVTKLDPIDTSRGVHFRFLSSATQLYL